MTGSKISIYNLERALDTTHSLKQRQIMTEKFLLEFFEDELKGISDNVEYAREFSRLKGLVLDAVNRRYAIAITVAARAWHESDATTLAGWNASPI